MSVYLYLQNDHHHTIQLHFLVDEKGKIYQIQNIKKRGVHTKKGNTEFGKKHGISNSNSFGIEVDAKHDKHVTTAQQQAVIRIMKLFVQR